jgi:hypothetical protein
MARFLLENYWVNHKKKPASRRPGSDTMKKTCRTSKTAVRLADFIEEERRKIGELSFDRLTSPAVIKSMEKMEEMINEYTLLVYVGKKDARQAVATAAGKKRPSKGEHD